LANWLPIAALALAIPLPLASLVTLGYWERAEALQVGLHAAAALASLAVVAVLWAEPARGLRCLRHPVVLTMAGVGLWSVLVAPLVRLPLLSLLGTVQSGLGALWFLDTAVLTACAVLVAEDPRRWRLLAWEAVAVTAVVAALKVADYVTEQPLLIYVSAYYGWLGIYLPFLARPWRDDRDIPLTVAALAVAVVVVAASLSRTAAVLLAGIVLWTAVGRLGRRVPLAGRLAESKGVAAVVVALAAILPYIAVRLWGGATTSASLHDRYHLQQMMHAALRADPSPLLGHGWGRTQDAFHAFLNVTGENLWQPTWIFLTSDYFNAHNWLLETLYAAGVPGVLLTVAAALALPLCAARADRAAATALASACLLFTGVWFQLCLSLPLLALAAAAVATPVAPPRAGRAATAAAVALLVAFGLGQAWAAGDLLAFGEAVGAMRQDIAAGKPVAVPDDPRGSDLAAAEVIRDFLVDLAGQGPQPAKAAAVRPMLDTLERRIPLTATTQLPVVGLGVLSQIYFSGELAWLAPQFPHADALWREWLDRSLALAPGRTDVAIPYLTRLATSGRLGEAEALARQFLAQDGNDPVGLYFAGLAEVVRPDQAAKRAGIDLLRRSVAAGIDRFMPLDPAVARAIGVP
jgi:hypothetical protein